MVSAAGTIETPTSIQRISQLVEWFLMDRNVEVVFRKNERGLGRLCPEFDIIYLMDGRLITERCLSMQIMCELQRRNFKFTLPQIMSCMTEQAWRYYIANQEYPEWLMAKTLQPIERRPRGRPRKMPREIAAVVLKTQQPKAKTEVEEAADG